MNYLKNAIFMLHRKIFKLILLYQFLFVSILLKRKSRTNSLNHYSGIESNLNDFKMLHLQPNILILWQKIKFQVRSTSN